MLVDKTCEACGLKFQRQMCRGGKYCSLKCAGTQAAKGRQRWIEATRETRFWSRVDRSGNCWTWTGSTDKFGYGTIKIDKKSTVTHRVAWQLTYGDPGEACVLHQCDNPPCVRPDHLFLGDRQLNSDDMIAKGREYHPSGETLPQHVLTEADVVQIRALRGKYKQVDIARMFGIVQPHVSRILRGESWKLKR